MFGYISINRSALPPEEKQIYRGYYCGLCRALRERFGAPARLLLTYDLTFLALLLTSLYEEDDSELCGTQHCLLHPLQKLPCQRSEYINYAADMTVLLTYHRLRDRWQDDHDQFSRAEAALLRERISALGAQYPRQVIAVDEFIRDQQAAEQQDRFSPEEMASLTGKMLGELLIFRDPLWQQPLRELGRGLGKFIYLMDAYEDIEQDIRKKRYNPLRRIYIESSAADFEQYCSDLLNTVMADCAEVFERLPILLNENLLRHIIYAGVWSRYEVIHSHRSRTAAEHTAAEQE